LSRAASRCPVIPLARNAAWIKNIFILSFYYTHSFNHIHRDRILGRNPDKSLQNFPRCYSQFPLQLCLEISISSNSRNLLQFLQNFHRQGVNSVGKTPGDADIWTRTLPYSKPAHYHLSYAAP
jgi:hypothetical protein